MKVDKTVKRETLYIAAVTVILSALLQAVFLVAGWWNYTVLTGNLLGGSVAVLNFFLMGLTVQKAVGEEQKNAAKRMQASQGYRLIVMGVALIAAATMPWFDLWAAALPLLFPRIGVLLHPLFFKDKE